MDKKIVFGRRKGKPGPDQDKPDLASFVGDVGKTVRGLAEHANEGGRRKFAILKRHARQWRDERRRRLSGAGCGEGFFGGGDDGCGDGGGD